MVKEFDVCHKFVDEGIKYFCWLKKENTWKLAILLAIETLLFLFLIKKTWEQNQNFLLKIIEEAKKSDLARYRWKVHQPLIEERKNLNCYTFMDWFDIIFTAQ